MPEPRTTTSLSETSFFGRFFSPARPVASLDRVADHRVLLVAARDLGHAALGERSLDELVEPVAVSLLERRALRLSVVGEDDELVRPRGVAARPVDPRELLVELAERLHRVRPLQAGVVGDLVVARERRVHRGAAFHHVVQHAVHDQVADEDAQGGAHQRVDAASVAARAHVAAASTAGRRSTSRTISHTNRTSSRVALNPFAKNAR